MATNSDDYARIAEALYFLHERHTERPDLKAVADHVGLSSFHFQRLFSRWAGVSPKRYLDHLALTDAKALLRKANDVLGTSLDAGYSGPGRLHDRFVQLDAVTPGQYAHLGADLEILYGWYPCPFGWMLLAHTGRGICWISFHDQADDPAGLEQLQQEWPRGNPRLQTQGGQHFAKALFSQDTPRAPLRLMVRGTNFQIQVWRALLRIPQGALTSYGRLAALLERPSAARAVGNAVGANPVSYLIPCHRVINALGTSGNYRWGETRKRALLSWESARSEILTEARAQSKP